MTRRSHAALGAALLALSIAGSARAQAGEIAAPEDILEATRTDTGAPVDDAEENIPADPGAAPTITDAPARDATDDPASDAYVDELDGWAGELALPVHEPAARLADPAHEFRPLPPPPPGTIEILGIAWRPQLEVRERLEVRSGSYLPGLRDAALVTSRARVGLEARWQSVRGLVQIQDARDLGITPGATTGASTGVHQGFLEIGGGNSFVRVGRQEIDWGSGRLIGSLNWQSAARSFDAVRARGELFPFVLDAMVAMVRPPRQFPYTVIGPDGTTESWAADSGGDWVAGLAIEWLESEALRLSTFFLYRHDGPLEPSAVAEADRALAPRRQRDVGAWSLRAAGRVDRRLRYEVEVITEMGSVQQQGFVAAAAIAEAHYLLDLAWQPELGGGGSVASGASPGGGIDELDNFYPSNHLIYGLIDLFGLRNQGQLFARAAITPDPRLHAALYARIFFLPEPGARWSNAGGQTIGVSPTNRESFVGGEIDLEVRWTPIDHVPLSAGYGLFLPGPAAAALGRPQPMHFVYAMAGVLFP